MYMEIIKEKNPELIIEKYSFNTEGQNNDIVIVNDTLVFKFPKYQQGIAKLEKEIDLLNILKTYITLDIPNYKYKNFEPLEVGRVFGGYKIIKGTSLKKDIFCNITKQQNIAKQLATFLKQLHSIPIEKININKMTNDDNYSEWKNLFEGIQQKLFKFMSKGSKDLISRNFNDFLGQDLNFKQTVIHGDFGPSNIIFDPRSKLISGIIDFNEVSIGDPAIDIASLIGPFGYGEDFVKTFESTYPNVQELMKRAKFYSSTFALQEALFGIEVGDEKAFEEGIKEYL